MPPIHRNGDSRSCGASTTVSGQSTVYADGKLVSVNGDNNTHGGGSLIARCKNVYAEGIMIVNVGDDASPDSKCPSDGGEHCSPNATSGSSKTYVAD